MTRIGWIRHLRDRWRRHVGDRPLERAIRSELDARGYGGSMAHILDLRLAAVMRPGWIQVDRFEVQARHLASGERHTLYGVAREDGRAGAPEIGIFDEPADRDARLGDWSHGLLTTARRPRGRVEGVLLFAFLGLVLVAIAGAILGGS